MNCYFYRFTSLTYTAKLEISISGGYFYDDDPNYYEDESNVIAYWINRRNTSITVNVSSGINGGGAFFNVASY